jgi:hypothetical protein
LIRKVHGGVDQQLLCKLDDSAVRSTDMPARAALRAKARELAEPRRRAALVCFLWQSYRDAVEQAVDMFDKLLTRAHTQAQN